MIKVEHTDSFLRIHHPEYDVMNSTIFYMKPAEAKNLLYVNNDNFKQVLFEKYGDDVVIIFSYDNNESKVITLKKKNN